MQALQPKQSHLPATLLWVAVICAGVCTTPLTAQESADSPVNTAEIDIVSDQSPETQKPAFDLAMMDQARADKARYEDAIARLETSSQQNVYNPALTEAYLNLAVTIETLGEDATAAEVYEKALQNVRISNGLYSPQQLPVLEHLLENNLARNNWQSVDNYSHLILLIARRNFAVGEQRRVDALDRFADWKIRAIREKLARNETQNLLETVSLYRNELTLLEESDDFDGKGIQRARLSLGEARSLLEVAYQVNNRTLNDYRSTTQRETTTQQCYVVRLANGQFTQVCEAVTVPNFDYYLDPAMRKNQELGMHLENIRGAISNAYAALQEDGDVAERNALLAEMQDLTNAYNTFVTDNNL